jgi:hypothetical protein
VSGGGSVAAPDPGGRWPTLLEAILRGVGHALSNRAAGLLALAEIPMDEHDAESLGMLPHEAARLQELLRIVKLLPAETAAVPAALLIADVARDACAVMALHPTGREVAWHITGEQGAAPVRVERWMLLRTLLLLLDGARQRANAAGSRSVEVRLGSSVDGTLATVALVVEGGERGDPLPLDDAYLSRLVERLCGTLSTAAPIMLSLPTLASRRRESGARD